MSETLKTVTILESVARFATIMYAGGYRDEPGKLAAFQHGMQTTCRMLADILAQPDDADSRGMPSLVREEFAALAHDQWAGWMRYMFSKATTDSEGRLVIPAWATARWARQMVTAYTMLSEDEKESDRVEAKRMMAVLITPRTYEKGD